MQPNDRAQLEHQFGIALDRARAHIGRSGPVDDPLTASPQTLITALSGGADSTATALLADSYAKQQGFKHHCVIIDHGLRPDSAIEAERVAARMRGRGMVASIQRVIGQPRGGVQAWARDQRYALLCAIARAQNGLLLMGHHAGDQAETIFMRLLRGSGLGGLAGMRLVHHYQGVPIVRPILEWSAGAADSICAFYGCEYERDPSNQDRRFERVRVRASLAATRAAPDGADLGTNLCQLAVLSRRLVDQVDRAIGDLCPTLHPAGFAWMPAAAMQRLSSDLWNRVVGRAIQSVGGAAHAPSQLALAGLRDRVMAGKAATLGGCQILPMTAQWRAFVRPNHAGGLADDSTYVILREIGRAPAEISAEGGVSLVFDRRWLVKVPDTGVLRLLGAPSRQDSGSDQTGALSPALAALPWALRKSLPVLDRLDGTRLYPQLDRVEMMGPTANQRAGDFQIRFLPAASDVNP